MPGTMSGMPTDYQRFSIASLKELARSAMLKVGASREHADIFAEGCVIADVRGIESHGVARLDGYVSSVERGNVQPNATPTVVSDAPSVALVDANSGIGHVASKFAIGLAIDKAKQT